VNLSWIDWGIVAAIIAVVVVSKPLMRRLRGTSAF